MRILYHIYNDPYISKKLDSREAHNASIIVMYNLRTSSPPDPLPLHPKRPHLNHLLLVLHRKHLHRLVRPHNSLSRTHPRPPLPRLTEPKRMRRLHPIIHQPRHPQRSLREEKPPPLPAPAQRSSFLPAVVWVIGREGIMRHFGSSLPQCLRMTKRKAMVSELRLWDLGG